MLADEIRVLEEQLLTPAVRASRAELHRLLSDEFLEFGSSGRVYTKSDIIALLVANPECAVNPTDFRVLALADGVVLATYRTESSVRSSIWRREAQVWRMVFHQGTPTARQPGTT